MSADLLKRRIAARQRIKEAGGKRFTLRRPTEFEMVKFATLSTVEYLAQCIDECDLTEADLIGGGSADLAVQFDRALVFDWLQEHPETWGPLSTELKDMIESHRKALEDAAKN